MSKTAKTRTRLTFDLDALLPGDVFTIGDQDVMIRPLGLLQYKTITSKLKALIGELSAAGVTRENFKQPESIVTIAEVLLTKFPDILEEVSNIAMEDLELLPLEVIVSLVDKCLEVNMRAKDSLLGNWMSLMGKMEKLGLTTEDKA